MWFGSFLMDLSALSVALIVAIYLYFKYCYQYWSKHGVPYLKPSFPFGNCKDSWLVQRQLGEMLCDWYKIMKMKGERHMGYYFLHKPFYMPIDSELVKNVMARDFQHFHERAIYCNEENDPLSAHLFSLSGLKWKTLRNKLSPTFTSGKMKKMFQTLVDCSDDLKNCLNEPASTGEPVDVRTVLSQFTTDVIGSCAFGIECNSFQDPNNDFARLGKKVFQVEPKERLQFFIGLMYPKLAEFLKLRITKKEVEDFFFKLVTETIEYREKNNVGRNDFMQLLMQLKNEGMVEHDDDDTYDKSDMTKLTMNEIVAQAFLFFVAGFETSSTTMTFALYELSLTRDIQEKVHEEILTVLKKHEGKITYDAIMEMHLLDRVVLETLRKHPPLLFLQRMCTKDYHVPDTDFVMEKGTVVTIPAHAIHYDPEYYPEPEKFDPDRFLEENKSSRPDYTYLPFGEGPRICIGLRFGMMQTKVGLCRLLKNYRFELNSKTRQPIKLAPQSIVALAEGGIWLDVKRYSN